MNQQAAQTTEARVQQDSLLALQSANEQLQQQSNKLEVDLQAALAYRHKCLQQKKELQLLRKQVAAGQAQNVPQPSTETWSSAEQPVHRQQQQTEDQTALVHRQEQQGKDQQSEAADPDAHASQEDVNALVCLLALQVLC